MTPALQGLLDRKAQKEHRLPVKEMGLRDQLGLLDRLVRQALLVEQGLKDLLVKTRLVAKDSRDQKVLQDHRVHKDPKGHLEIQLRHPTVADFLDLRYNELMCSI